MPWFQTKTFLVIDLYKKACIYLPIEMFCPILDFVLFSIVEKLLSNFRHVRNLEAFLNYVSFYKRKGMG